MIFNKQQAVSDNLKRYDSRSTWGLRIGALLLFAVFYFGILNPRPDFTPFNCHDSESYLALSYGMVHGLGYTRSMIPGDYVGHTTWPPGVPLLMMPAIAASGDKINWVLVKGSMAGVGIFGIVIAWILGRRLSGRTSGGDWAAVSIGMNPFYWDFSHQAMAEVPMVVWILLSLLLIDYFWVYKCPTRSQAIGVGIVSGLGMLFKGHAIGLLLAPAAYLIGDRVSFGVALRSRIGRWLFFGIGFVIPFVAWNIRNSSVHAKGFDGMSQIRMIRAKIPTDLESPLLTASESLQVIKRNLIDYVIYRIPEQILPFLWDERTSHWKGSGLLFLTLSVVILGLAAPWNWKAVLSLHLVGIPIFLLNIQYALGGAARFWVPYTMLTAVLLSLRVDALLSSCAPYRRRTVFIGYTAVMAVSLTCYVVRHEKEPYNTEDAWAAKAQLFSAISKLKLAPTGVLTSNCHAFQLVTGLSAPMTNGPETTVDYVIFDLRKPPPGARTDKWKEILRIDPWCFCHLPVPTSVNEINVKASQ